jgi:hypothetical protein
MLATNTAGVPKGWVLAILAVLGVGSLVCLVAFGIVGIGRTGMVNIDGQVLYAAGRAWLLHLNPYDHAALAQAVARTPGMDLSEVQFLYPPQSSAICIALGTLSYVAARESWLFVNLAAVAMLLILACCLVRVETPRRWLEGTLLLGAAILASPFTAHVLWLGQTTLVVFTAVLAAWYFADRGKWLVAGICLGVASFKPQICMFVVLWLILERKWRVLLAAAASAALLAVYPLSTDGPIAALQEWRAGIGTNYAIQYNLPSFPHKIGLESLVYSLGWHWSATILLCVGIAATVGLWRFRSRFQSTDTLSLLIAITFTFSSYLHDYDYVALLPIYISLWRLAPPSIPAIAASLLLIALLFVPQRLFQPFGSPTLDQWRTVLVVMLACMVVRLSLSRAPRADLERVPDSPAM